MPHRSMARLTNSTSGVLDAAAKKSIRKVRKINAMVDDSGRTNERLTLDLFSHRGHICAAQ
jgi:hypothetical protein